MEENSQITVTLTPEFRLEQALAEDPETITKLTIAGTITDDDFAFIRITMADTLQELDMSNASIDEIKVCALCRCFALTIITLPDWVAKIHPLAFLDCPCLTSINISKNKVAKHPFVSENDAFIEFVLLLDLNAQPSFTSENGVLFNREKTKLIRYPQGRQGAYIIPDTVSTIGCFAFYECRGLTSVKNSDSIEHIGDFAFAHCKNLTTKLPDSIIHIGDYAFEGCSNFISKTIEELKIYENNLTPTAKAPMEFRQYMTKQNGDFFTQITSSFFLQAFDLANKQKYTEAIEICTDALVMVKYSNLDYPLVYFINMYYKEWQRIRNPEKLTSDIVDFYNIT